MTFTMTVLLYQPMLHGRFHAHLTQTYLMLDKLAPAALPRTTLYWGMSGVAHEWYRTTHGDSGVLTPAEAHANSTH